MTEAAGTIRRLAGVAEIAICAKMMAESEPWLTLRRSLEASIRTLQDPDKEVYVLEDDEEILGFVVLDLRGPFPGYLQTVCVRSGERGQGHGARLIEYAEERIFRVGNVMIDTLREYEAAARARDVAGRLGLQAGGYAVCTLHRPSNVDDPGTLRTVVQILTDLQSECPVAFPMHPRTRTRLETFGLADALLEQKNVQAIDPLGYLDFIGLMATAALVLTDSGGVQEETTALGIPCLTLRESTERPVTVTLGTNAVVGTDPNRILAAARRALNGDWPRGILPEGWDGHAAERIAAVLCAERPTLAPRSPIMSRVT